MIEIIRKHAEQKAVNELCQNCGFSIHFDSFDELIESLTKLELLAHSRNKSKYNQAMEAFDQLSKANSQLSSFNFIEKKITKKDSFKKASEEVAELTQLVEKIDSEKNQTKTLSDKLNLLLSQAFSQKNEFLKKKTFEDYGFSYESAKAFIESMGQSAVLTLADLELFDPNAKKQMSSFDDYVAVHITSYEPDKKIKTSFSATKDDILDRFFSYSTTQDPSTTQDIFELGNKTYYIPYQPFRNTVHFCLNSPVDGGFFGASDWEQMKYAIICPYNDIKPQIKGSVPQDTFIEGEYNFTDNTVILCPANEKDEIQKKNPKATIVPYDNSILKTQENSSSKAEPTMASAHTFTPFVISNILGYKFLKTHPHYGFIDESETKTYRQLSEGAGFEYAWHAHTQSHVDEENKWKIYKNALILQIIEKEGFSFDEIKDGFMFYYFSNIDESLIDETLEFLKPAIGPESLEKLKSNIKALNKARIKYNESSSLAKNTDEIKSIVDSIANTEDLQPNA